jgi:hypothetical protein
MGRLEQTAAAHFHAICRPFLINTYILPLFHRLLVLVI